MDFAIKIRAAATDDFESLSGLAFQLGYPCEAEAVRKRVESILKKTDETILVAERQGKVVGWISLQVVERFYLDPFVDISGFVVDKDHRNQGIGKELIRAAEDWVKGKGYKLLRLKTNVTRKDAHRFYENNGFRKTKEQFTYTKMFD